MCKNVWVRWLHEEFYNHSLTLEELWHLTRFHQSIRIMSIDEKKRKSCLIPCHYSVRWWPSTVKCQGICGYSDDQVQVRHMCDLENRTEIWMNTREFWIIDTQTMDIWLNYVSCVLSSVLLSLMFDKRSLNSITYTYHICMSKCEIKLIKKKCWPTSFGLIVDAILASTISIRWTSHIHCTLGVLTIVRSCHHVSGVLNIGRQLRCPTIIPAIFTEILPNRGVGPNGRDKMSCHHIKDTAGDKHRSLMRWRQLTI